MTQRDEDTEFLDSLFNKDNEVAAIQAEGSRTIVEGNGTHKSFLSKILYPFYYVKNFVSQELMRRRLRKLLSK